MNINTVHMTGNLTDDPELRYTPSGKPVVSASIANNEHYTDAQGEEKKVTTFVNLQIWGKPAENFGNLVKKLASYVAQALKDARRRFATGSQHASNTSNRDAA